MQGRLVTCLWQVKSHACRVPQPFYSIFFLLLHQKKERKKNHRYMKFPKNHRQSGKGGWRIENWRTGE
jgi:hypothetical protein